MAKDDDGDDAQSATGNFHAQETIRTIDFIRVSSSQQTSVTGAVLPFHFIHLLVTILIILNTRFLFSLNGRTNAAATAASC